VIRNIALWGVALAVFLLMLIVREERLAAQGKVPMGRLRRLWFGPERRRHPRYRVNWSVRYRRSEISSSAQTRDISQSGAGLTLLEKVPLGSQLDLEVPIPGRELPLRVTAVVVWTKEVSAEPGVGEAQRRFFVGVHFQNLSSTLQQELAALLKIPGYPLDPERPAGPANPRPAADPALYAALKRRLWLADLGLTLGLFCILIFSGLAVRWGHWVETRAGPWPLQVALYAGILWAAAALAGFPLDWVRGFRLEHRFGLSTQSFGSWLKDHSKGLALGGLMGLGIAEGLELLLRAAPAHWWLWVAAAWMAWGALLTQAAPTLLIPLFYKQQPLEQGPARERLEALLARCKTRVHGIFSVNLSRTTRKANACLCGLGGSRRVLLSDTLLSRYPVEEIEVVLAHELGHHRLRHIGIGISLSAAAAGLSCFGVDRLARGWLAGLGIAGLADLPALVVLGFGLFLAGLLLMPITQGISRRLERQADQFALDQTRNPAAFITAMRRLAEQKLAEQNPPLWAEWLLYDHPPISKRIKLAQQWVPGQRPGTPGG
jgi:STE24 endopeptidase